MNKITEDLQNEVQWELENNILPFWMNRMIDNEYGGFHGQITGNGQRVVHAPKGAILNARILGHSPPHTVYYESRNIWKRRPVQNATLSINSTTKNSRVFTGN